jgi:hypothetical protein
MNLKTMFFISALLAAVLSSQPANAACALNGDVCVDVTPTRTCVFETVVGGDWTICAVVGNNPTSVGRTRMPLEPQPLVRPQAASVIRPLLEAAPASF